MRKICLALAVMMMICVFSGCGAGEESQSAAPSQKALTALAGYELDVPEGFTAGGSEGAEVYTGPDGVSNITVEVQPADPAVMRRSEGEFETLYADRQCKVSDLRPVLVDGIAALFVAYTTGDGSRCFEYHVAADRNFVFRFTDSTPGNSWRQAYASAASGIRLLRTGESTQPDHDDLEQYALECGVSLQAMPGMSRMEAEGFTECIGCSDAVILVLREEKQEALTLEQYAQRVSQSNELDEFAEDSHGNLWVSFDTTDEDGALYCNMLTVKESEDSFWLFQMTCAAEDWAVLGGQFPLWAASIEF